jgi:hypothetical protein
MDLLDMCGNFEPKVFETPVPKILVIRVEFLLLSCTCAKIHFDGVGCQAAVFAENILPLVRSRGITMV